jgi:isoaspartyl peptidase/L-asparaginase-like protein (Ntn-hydrolase superfamily)
MTKVPNFTDTGFGDNTLMKTAVYSIIKKVRDSQTTANQQHLNVKQKTERILDMVAAVAVNMKANCCVRPARVWLLPMGFLLAPCTISCMTSWGL